MFKKTCDFVTNWTVVFLTALLITGIVHQIPCFGDIQKGGSTGTLSRDMAHISVGSTPIQKIEIYQKVAGSDITFVNQSGYFNFDTRDSSGSSSIANANLTSVNFDSRSNANLNRYRAFFTPAFVKTKTPLTIEIDGTSYPLSYLSGQSLFRTAIIPSSDRVSATDLTKAINFELVDNEQVTLGAFSSGQATATIEANGPIIEYRDNSYGTQSTRLKNRWFVRYRTGSGFTPTSLPDNLIVNGKSHSLTRLSSTNVWYSDIITDVNFQPSSSKLSWGINIRFADGTYYNNTRSNLFADRLVKVWEDLEGPTITAFTVDPSTIDLDDDTIPGTSTRTLDGGSSVRIPPRTGVDYYADFREDTGLPGNSAFFYITSDGTAENWGNPPGGTWVFYAPQSLIQSKGTPRQIVVGSQLLPLVRHGTTNYYIASPSAPVTVRYRTTTRSLTFKLNVIFRNSRGVETDLFNLPEVPITLTFTIGVTGTAGETTTAQILRLPDNTQIGTNFVASAGSNIATTLPNIAHPQKTTTYRLFATNAGGNAHKDVTVTVTKNPLLTNCRRTGYIDATTTYFFGFTLQGLPRPTVTYRFSGGQQGTVPSSHLTQGANPYTWTSSGWQIAFANSNAQSLTLTATNSSGTTTCSISNIDD